MHGTLRLQFIALATMAATLLLASCPDGTGSGLQPAIILDFTGPASQAGQVRVADDFAGMCHAGYQSNLTLEYEMLNEMDVVWMHRDFTWGTIESSDDNWNFSQFDSYVQRGNNEGKKIMGMLLYGVDWVHTAPGGCGEARGDRIICNDAEIAYFCDYAKRTVRRYNGNNGYGKVDAWLIWNEPDLAPRFWTGTQAQFFALNKAVAQAIRAQDTQDGTHTFLLGGVFTALVSDSWITGLFQHGGMIEHKVDGIAFHPYSFLPESSASVFNAFKEKVRPYGYADKIWLNEVGYPTYLDKGPIPSGRYGTDQWEDNMPEVVTKTFTLLAAAGARNLTWYHFSDGPNRNNNDSESWFGLVWRRGTNDWEKKGGYYGYAVCANNIPGKTYKRVNLRNVPSDLRSYYFEGSNSCTLVVWNNNDLTPREIHITLPGKNHRLWDLVDGESESIGRTTTYTLQPTISDERKPLFITWDR